MKNNNFKIIIGYILLFIVVILIGQYFIENMNKQVVTYSDVVNYFNNEQVESFKITGGQNLELTIKGQDAPVDYVLRDVSLFWSQLGDTINQQLADGTITSYDDKAPMQLPFWVSLLPYAAVIVVLILLWLYVVNQATGGKGSKLNSFSRAKAKLGSDEKNKKYFADVAGMDEEKEELREIVDFLRNPQKFTELGARIPHGVLLVGPPGTGKTLLAKAVAGEAGVPFYSESGSDFVEMYVGVGASRVRDLFETAKRNPAAIIFIDEIDAVGRHRGAGLGGGHDEREQTLNQLLVEMDGFGSNDHVIIIAATNRPDILDPALLRAGRFDRQVTVNPPDIRGREEILKVHAKGKPFEANVDMGTIAKATAGFTGADLENTLNEAAILAARKQKKLIGMNELEEAMMKVVVGSQKKSRVINDREKHLTAFHEAGHAIVTKMLQTQNPVQQISIIPTGRAGGYTLSPPTEDKYYMSKLEMQDEIVTLLGGRVAERLTLHDISTGASNDIERASAIARKMVTQYGMSDRLGPIVFGSGHEEVFLGRELNNQRNYSEQIAAQIDEEVKKIVDTAYARAEQILTENMDKLHFVADFLFKNEIMDGDQFEAAMSGNISEEQLLEMVSEKRRRSEQENQRAKEIAEQRRVEEERHRDEMRKREREEAAKRDRNNRNGPGPGSGNSGGDGQNRYY